MKRESIERAKVCLKKWNDIATRQNKMGYDIPTAMADFAADEIEIERQRIADALFLRVLKFNNDARHDATDPCLVCDILDATEKVWQELVETK